MEPEAERRLLQAGCFPAPRLKVRLKSIKAMIDYDNDRLSDRLFREVKFKLAKQPLDVESPAIDAASRVGLPQPWSTPHEKEETCCL